MKKCAICQRQQSITFTLEIEDEFEGEGALKTICNSCYDTIATVALRAVKEEVDDLKAQLRTIGSNPVLE